MKKTLKISFVFILIFLMWGCSSSKKQTAEVAFKKSFDEYIQGQGAQWTQLRNQGIYVSELGERFTPLDNHMFDLFTEIEYEIIDVEEKSKDVVVLTIDTHFNNLFPSHEAINEHLDVAESLDDLDVNQLILIVNDTKSSCNEKISIELTFNTEKKEWTISGGSEAFSAVIIANLNGYFN